MDENGNYVNDTKKNKHRITRIKCGEQYYDVKEEVKECPGCGLPLIGLALFDVEDEIIWQEFKKRFPDMIHI